MGKHDEAVKVWDKMDNAKRVEYLTRMQGLSADDARKYSFLTLEQISTRARPFYEILLNSLGGKFSEFDSDRFIRKENTRKREFVAKIKGGGIVGWGDTPDEAKQTAILFTRQVEEFKLNSLEVREMGDCGVGSEIFATYEYEE